jgi:transposase InsO family protein
MSNIKFPTHAWGLLYLANHHIHDYKLQALHEDFTRLQQLARRVFIDQGAVYTDQVLQQIRPDKPPAKKHKAVKASQKK